MKITKRQLRRIIREEKARLVELGIDRAVSPLARDIAEVILVYDQDQRDSLESYGIDVQMLKDLLDEVKNIVLPELDRRAAKTDSETTGDDWRQSLDWPGGI